jgi:predicted Zn-dependent protease
MVKRYIIGAVAVLLLLQGCKSTHKPTVENTKYKRKPITEVSQEQLSNDALLIEAKTQSELGNNEEAEKIYRTLLKADPTYAVAYFELGGMFYVAGMMDSAAFYTEKAYGLSPKNVWYKLQLADIYKKIQRLDDAAKVSEELVNEHPEVLEYYYELVNVYLANHKVENAIEVFNRLEKRVGISEEVSLQKQRLWEMINRPDKAIKEIEQLAKAYPNDKKYNSILAELFMSKKDYDKAYLYYKRVLEADPNDDYIHISLANYYKLTNQPQKAFEELKQGFANNKLTSKEKTQILTSFYTSEEFYGVYSKYAYELVDMIMINIFLYLLKMKVMNY